MKVKEADLPGVGKKYVVETEEGAEVILIVHNTGKREICILPEGGEEEEGEPACIIPLTEEEAKEIAFLLAGTKYQPTTTDKFEFLTREIVMDWIKVENNSKLVGKSIAESEIRKKTGVSLIAIIRGDKVIPSPDPTEKINAGDTIVVVGTREKIKGFKKFFEGLKSA